MIWCTSMVMDLTKWLRTQISNISQFYDICMIPHVNPTAEHMRNPQVSYNNLHYKYMARHQL